ncbi:MAG: hypothetical protein RRY40_01480, partial [Oscillospiraceae bacterium]
MKMKKTAAVLLALMLVLISAPSVAADDAAYKQQISSLSSKYAELEKQQKAISNEINKTKNDKEKQIALKKQLDNQIYGVRQQIGVLAEKIEILESNMQTKELQVEEAEKKIKDNSDMLKNRLNAMYKSHNATVLGLVMGADNFGEFLSRAQVASKIAEHDQKLIAELEVELAAIETAKTEIEENQTEVLEAKTQMSEKQNILGTQLSQTEGMIQDIEALEKDYRANKAKIDKQMAEVQSEVDAIYAQIKSVGKYEGRVMGWP